MAELGCKPLRLRWRFGTILTSILSPRSYGHYERVRGLLTALPRPTPCRWCVRRKQTLPWNRPFGINLNTHAFAAKQRKRSHIAIGNNRAMCGVANDKDGRESGELGGGVDF